MNQDDTRISEERLLALMKATSDVIYRMSPDWETMTELYGRGFLADTDEPNPNWMDKYIHPEDQAFVLDVINNCIKNKNIFELEHRVLQVDESIGWTFSRAIPLFDENGDIREWFGAASDITERKRNEEALRASEERFRAIQDNSLDRFTILKPFRNEQGEIIDFTYVYLNARAAKISGLRPEELVGRRMTEVWPSFTQTQFFTIYKKVAETGRPLEFEDIYNSDGLDDCFYVTVTPLPDGIAIATQIITERKKTEEVLSFQINILNSVHDAIVATDVITYWNGMSEKLFGWNAEEAIGKNMGDLLKAIVPGSSKEAIIAKLLEDNYFEGEVIYHHKDGLEIYTDVHSYFLSGSGFISSFRDIAEGKKAEEALRESEEKYRLLFENAEYGFVVFEPLLDKYGNVKDLRFLEINPAFERETGFKIIDFLGKRLLEAIPDIEPNWLNVFDRAIKKGKPIRFEGYNRNTSYWYEVVVFPFANGLLGEQFINVTGRKRLELHKTFLLEISRKLAGPRIIKETMDNLVEMIGKYFDVTWCVFTGLIEDPEYTEVSNYWNVEGNTFKGSFRMRDFITDEFLMVHNAGGPAIVSNTQTDSRVNAQAYGQKGMSFINAPISQGGQWRFLVSIICDKPREWRSDEVALLQDIAIRVWARLEQVRSEDELRKSEKRAKLL